MTTFGLAVLDRCNPVIMRKFIAETTYWDDPYAVRDCLQVIACTTANMTPPTHFATPPYRMLMCSICRGPAWDCVESDYGPFAQPASILAALQTCISTTSGLYKRN